MRRIRNMLLCGVLVGAAALSAPIAFAEEEVVPIETQVDNGSGAVIQSYIYEWRYKFVGEHVYKRRYNCSKSCWEGDWILVY